MTTLLNRERPPVFCPGCGHEQVVRALDLALQQLELRGEEVALVTDIGCAGLFDTFFHTHAMHGLHGRALTYATGLKLARPELTVIVIMGDGGLGIGGAHVLSSCRRNLDLTLLVLNNFNYGMTGGQYSATTPTDAVTSSGFLGGLEPPLDICSVGVAAGAPYVHRFLGEDSGLSAAIAAAIQYPGFSLFEVRGTCTGRFAWMNRGRGLKSIVQGQGGQTCIGAIAVNERDEYGAAYRNAAARQTAPRLQPPIAADYSSTVEKRFEIVLLGAAGQRVNTAGEILCLGAMSAGLHVSQKSDYPITVLRGHSVSEVVLSAEPVTFTGIERPDVVLALAQEGVLRKKHLFELLDTGGLVIAGTDIGLPETKARVVRVDILKDFGVSKMNRAVCGLAVLASLHPVLSWQMLATGLERRLQGKALDETRAVVNRVRQTGPSLSGFS